MLPKAVKHMLVWFNCMTFQLIIVLMINLAVLQMTKIVTAGKNYPVLLMKDKQCQAVVNLIYLTSRQCLTSSFVRYFLKSVGMNGVYWTLVFLVCLEPN